MNASEMARALGRRGGRARAARLSRDEKQRIASAGGHARQQSLEIARRIAANFLYAGFVNVLSGRDAIKVQRQRTCADRLPGIYPGDGQT
jgi:hypothetical protein